MSYCSETSAFVRVNQVKERVKTETFSSLLHFEEKVIRLRKNN